jgi:DNA topoisomerase IB
MLDIKKIWPVFVESVNEYYNYSEKELKNMTKEQINSGLCDSFAEAINEVYGGNILSSDDFNEDFNKRFKIYPTPHSFIQIGDKYYDAEELNGVSHYYDLPIFKRQLKQLKESKMSLVDKILKEFQGDVLDQKIKNPKTGHEVKVSSALSYDDSEPVKKKALAMVNKASKTKEPVAKTAQKVKGVQDMATDIAKGVEGKKNARSHKPKSKSYGISKECVEFIKSKGYTKLNVLPQSFVKPEEIEFNPALDEGKNSDTVWVCKFPVILPNGNRATKTAYTAGFMKKSQVKKYKKISKIKQEDIDKLEENTKKLLSANDDALSNSAAVLRIILKTGLRVGSLDEAETGNVGVRTLKAENVIIKGNKVHLSFIGKSYQENLADVDDADVAKFLKGKLAGKKPHDFVFDMGKDETGNYKPVSYGQIGKVMDKINPKGINPKDLRTYKATETAKKLLQDPSLGAPPPIPTDEKEIKKAVKDKLASVFAKVAEILNNTPAMAKNSYVHPVVITDFLDSLGLEPKQVGYKHVTLESKQLKEGILTPEEKQLVNGYISTIKTKLAGRERRDAINNLVILARTKTSSPIRSVSDALAALDYVEPKVSGKMPGVNSITEDEETEITADVNDTTVDSETVDGVTFTSMDEMFDKYPADNSNVDDSDISEDEMNNCEEYEIPEWFYSDDWVLVKKGTSKPVVEAKKLSNKSLKESEEWHNPDGSINPDKEYKYLTTVKPKYTFNKLVAFSKPLFKAFVETGAEKIISKYDSTTPVQDVKAQFIQALTGNKFDELLKIKFKNPEIVKKQLFHTLFYYHHAK